MALFAGWRNWMKEFSERKQEDTPPMVLASRRSG